MVLCLYIEGSYTLLLGKLEIFTYSTHVSNLIRYIIQVGVLHGLTSRDSFRRITPEHFIEEVQTLLIEIGHKRVQWSD